MPPRLRYAKSDVPEGRSGRWAVERFAIRDPGDDRPRVDPRPEWVRAEPGLYTRLRLDSIDYMTDLYEEWWSQRASMWEAVVRGGDVLVTGLGLGLFVETILRCEPPAVRSVTVIEASPDVVALVGDHLERRYSPSLRIVLGDAFRWRPPEECRYSVIWHDIWPSPFDPGSWRESHELFARYAPWGDWQGSWALDYLSLVGLDDPVG